MSRVKTQLEMQQNELKRSPEDRKIMEELELLRKEKLSKNNEFRLYHDFRVDELRSGLANLHNYEPYKSNADFDKLRKVFTQKLDRFNIANYKSELKYIVENIKIPESYRKIYYLKEDEMMDLQNILHLAAHSLGDVYMTEKDFESAKKYFLLADKVYPYQSYSGTTMSKDANRITADLAEVAKELNQK